MIDAPADSELERLSEEAIHLRIKLSLAADAYALVGDSSMHTNPTMGRGTPLAFAQAKHLTSSLNEFHSASAELVTVEEEWAMNKLKIWFDSQVTADATLADRFDKLAVGKPLPEPDEGSRTRGALPAAAREEPAVASEFRRAANLLITPAELLASPVIKQAVGERLKRDGFWPEYFDLLPRRDFERMIS